MGLCITCQLCRNRCIDIAVSTENSESISISQRKATRSVLQKSTTGHEESIDDSETEELDAEEAPSQMRRLTSRNDIFISCDIDLRLKSNMPSIDAVNTDKKLCENEPKGFMALVNRCVDAVQHIASILYPINTKKLLGAVGERLYRRYCDDSICNNELVLIVASVDSASSYGSTERRVARAILTEYLNENELAFLRNNELITFSRGKATKRAAIDFGRLLEGEKLVKSYDTSNRKCDEDKVRFCVDFILSNQNVGTFSWGVKVVRLSANEKTILPRLVRRMSMRQMYDNYCASTNTPLSISSFRLIVTNITFEGEKLFSCIDYITADLLNDQVQNLQQVLEFFAAKCEYHPDRKESLERYIQILRNFLKYQYASHSMIQDNCATHDLQYSLGAPSFVKPSNCALCNFPNFAIDELRKYISGSLAVSRIITQDMVKDATNFIKHVEDKLELYRGHVARCVQQQEAVKEVLETLKRECETTRTFTTHAVLNIDWKMKFLVESSRLSQSEWFARRGYGWHGVMVSFYRYDTKKNTPELVRLFIDQILKNGHEQNCVAVVSMIEAAIHAIKKHLPFLKTVTIVSDNATCYHGKALLVLISIMNNSFPIKVRRMIKFGTQDGKTGLDGHFGTASRKIKDFLRNSSVNTTTAIRSPDALAWALQYKGGLRYSMTMLVRLNGRKLRRLEKKILKSAMNSIRTPGEKLMDVEFLNFEDQLHAPLISEADIKKCNKTFSIKVFECSNVGSGSILEFTVGHCDRDNHGEVGGGSNGDDVDIRSNVNDNGSGGNDMEYENNNEDNDLESGENCLEGGDHQDDETRNNENEVADDENETEDDQVGDSDYNLEEDEDDENVETYCRFTDGPHLIPASALTDSQGAIFVDSGDSESNTGDDDDDDDDWQIHDDLEIPNYSTGDGLNGENMVTGVYVMKVSDFTKFSLDSLASTQGSAALQVHDATSANQESIRTPGLTTHENSVSIREQSSALAEANEGCSRSSRKRARAQLMKNIRKRISIDSALGNGEESQEPVITIAVPLAQESSLGTEQTNLDTSTPVHNIVPLRTDLVAFAVRYAAEQISNDNNVIIRDAKSEMLPEYDLTEVKEYQSTIIRKQGWARAPRHGNTLGYSFMTTEYKSEITKMFNAGKNDQSKKLTPSQIIQRLKNKFPDRFGYPGENAIKSLITSLISAEKRKNLTGSSQQRSYIKYPVELREILQQIVEDNDDISVKEAFQELKSNESTRPLIVELGITDAKLQSYVTRTFKTLRRS